MFAAIALVEHHDARIDEFQSLTIDKAEFGGHVYLDKAPGMTLLALPAVAIAEHVSTPPADPADGLGCEVRTLDDGAAAAGGGDGQRAADRARGGGAATTSRCGPAAARAARCSRAWPSRSARRSGAGRPPCSATRRSPICSSSRCGRCGAAGEERATRFAAIAGAALGLAVLIEFQAVLAGSVIAIVGRVPLAQRPPRSLPRRWPARRRC